MVEWRETTLGEIANCVGGVIQTGPFGSQLHESDYSDAGIPVVMPKNIVEGRVSESDIARVSSEHIERLSRHKLVKGDIVYGRRGDIGRQALVGDAQAGWLCGTGCLRISLGSTVINPLFLHYYLRQESVIKWISGQAIGATLPNLNTGILKSVPVYVPPLPIQKRIAGILSAYDELIENNQRRIRILEEMARSLYREWFVHFRYPGHEDVPLVDSPLGSIPQGWEVVALEDICERITDGAHKSPKSVESGLPMASVKDMHDFGFDLSTCRHISEDDYIELDRQDSVVKENDVLVAKDGSYLKHTFVVEKDMKVALLSSIAMLRPNEKVLPHFLAVCLRSEAVKGRMKQCVSGVAVPRIILKDFRKFQVVLPPNDLQVKWNALAGESVKMSWNLIAQNQSIKTQRDLLLPKLLSGQVALEGVE